MTMLVFWSGDCALQVPRMASRLGAVVCVAAWTLGATRVRRAMAAATRVRTAVMADSFSVDFVEACGDLPRCPLRPSLRPPGGGVTEKKEHPDPTVAVGRGRPYIPTAARVCRPARPLAQGTLR